MKHVKIDRVFLKKHPSLNEAWVQQIIADDPSILGLGELILRDKERIQPKAGRLDLLLEDSDSSKRYEVEVQLGSTDESHVVRTVEYWDLERKRYPQYEHCAVIIAEDITSRFLNVISLFNGTIPLIAIQMTAIQVGDGVGLVFTRVIDEVALGLPDDDEVEVTDRAYWEKKVPHAILAVVDQILTMVKNLDDAYELKYTKFYIGMSKHGVTNNFVLCSPRRKHVRFALRIPKSQQLTDELEESDVDIMEHRRGRYCLRLRPGDLDTPGELVERLLQLAYENS